MDNLVTRTKKLFKHTKKASISSLVSVKNVLHHTSVLYPFWLILFQAEDCDEGPNIKVIVGICAMEKKSLSKPMKQILTRMLEFEYIESIIFPEKVIIEQPVEEWPICDCLIAFHSDGFPLEKTMDYAKLRKPYIINSLQVQFDIQDRRKVYKTLEDAGIEIPR